jgi:hypothetical protein
MYVDFLEDPKMLALAFEDQRHFIGLLALKSAGTLDQDCAEALMDRIVSQRLWVDHQAIAGVKRRLIDAGLINDSWQPIAWEKRQRASDKDPTSAERKRRERDRKRQVNQQDAEVTKDVTDESRVMSRKSHDEVTPLEEKREEKKREEEKKHLSDSGESNADAIESEKEKPAKHTPEDRDLAARMLKAIREVAPSTKGSSRWPDVIRLMRERDGRTMDEIQAMFDWANADDFWRSVILSPGNLRDKWPQLEAQRSRKASPKPAEIRRPRKSLLEEYRRA